jgi:thiosulfate/3-mercaptopyruvate sulfurtransferase
MVFVGSLHLGKNKAMKQRFLFALFVFWALAATAAGDPAVIASPQWVHEHRNDPGLVILQVNFLKLDYEREHIAGARFLWPDWLAPDNPETGSFNIPEPGRATEVLRSLGISRNSTVVLCHVRNEVTVTARMFLTLEQLGLHGRVLFLNGGLEAWKKAGFPVTKDIPVVKKGNFKVKTGNLIVDKDYVLRALRSDTAVVVDARMKRFYDGEPTGNPRDGHITGALNLPFPDMLDSTNAFKSAALLEANFNAVVPDKKKEIVLYCFIGQTACVDYMAGRLLGYRIRLYDASLQEWSRREELPMEKTKE